MTKVWGPLQTTYFICLTMVLFPDSPAPEIEGTDVRDRPSGLWEQTNGLVAIIPDGTSYFPQISGTGR